MGGEADSVNLGELPSFYSCICVIAHIYLHMQSESDIEDIVIQSYVELYLKSLNESRPHRFVQIIKKRMLELIKRKQLRNK